MNELTKICPVCKKPALEDDWKFPNRTEYLCENFHFWHKCAIHGKLALGGAPLERQTGVMQKDLKQANRCSCFINDHDVAVIWPLIENNVEAEEALVAITWRLKKNKTQKREIQIVKDSLEQKNLELDAMHYVWCDGGCGGGVHRFKEMEGKPLTEEIVETAEWNVKRMRSYYEAKSFREKDHSVSFIIFWKIRMFFSAYYYGFLNWNFERKRK